VLGKALTKMRPQHSRIRNRSTRLHNRANQRLAPKMAKGIILKRLDRSGTLGRSILDTDFGSLRPPTGRDERISLSALTAIFLEARFKTVQRQRAPVQRDANRIALSSDLKNVCFP
jgi:hypothetical protein